MMHAWSLAMVLWGCRVAPQTPPGVMVVSQESEATWVRNFNPLMVTGGARWPTRAGIYEPLMIYHVLEERYEPWLATDYAWDDDGLGLELTIREGVRWSDGQGMDAVDVGYTFELLKAHPPLDAAGVWKHLTSIHVDEAEGVVRFSLAEPYAPLLSDIASQPIVPEHVWSDVDDPVLFTNPEPVATGPFTEVRRFESQVWEIGKNPHYWQEGRPYVEALRFPAIQSNDQVNLAMIRGDIDWSGKFVPAVERVYVGADPQHHRYWFPLTGGTVMMYPNTQRPPLDQVDVRRALSLAIDRELVVKVAMYGYSRPSHPSGLSDTYANWRDDSLDALASGVSFDPERAGRLLDEAGFPRGADGVRRGKDGTPLTLTLEVVSAWSDWVRAAQVITRNLSAIGVPVTLKTKDFGAWFEALTRGEFDLSISWSTEGPTPFHFYAALMGAETSTPLGETASSGWSRLPSPRMEDLLEKFAGTTDVEAQRALVDEMQAVFVDELPSIPLFPNPSWGSCNTKRFVDWPSPETPYARLSPNHAPEPLLVMTRVRPR